MAYSCAKGTARSISSRNISTPTAYEHGLNQAKNLLHGDEDYVFADAGYRGAEKREELKDAEVDWHIAERPGKFRALKKHPRINKDPINIKCIKASIRAKVEHPFRIIKCQFGFTKARYRCLMKNDGKLATLFALANIVRVGQVVRT